VGINTAINPRANTIGFAVPINLAKTILPQLESRGRVSRGYLGVQIRPVTEDFQELLELEGREGALVDSVLADSPADEAGVERLDVIVEFDGKKVETMEELPKLVAATAVGTKAEVVVLRDGERKELTVVLAELDPTEVAGGDEEAGEETGSYGLAVQRLTPELAERLGISEDTRGVVVSSVDPESPADEAGLQRGDVIVEVNRKPVDGLASFRDQIGKKKKGALLVVRRGDSERLVPLRPAG
jgi:serine protease Do